MKTHIQTRGFVLTRAIQLYAHKRLKSAVGFAERHIHRIQIKLSDINGPRGGNDKRCKLILTLQGLPTVVIEDTETDLYAAIDRAVARAANALTKKIRRPHYFKADLMLIDYPAVT